MRAPRAGDLIKLPTLAQTFRTLAKEGKKGFYTGRIARSIINTVQSLGGHLTLDDLLHHLETGSETVEPISLKFTGQGTGEDPLGGIELWEHPPNGQGLVALLALGIIQELEKQGKIPRFTPEQHNSAEYLHTVIEALRIAFADARWFVSDPSTNSAPLKQLLSREYLSSRAALFNPSQASAPLTHGDPYSYPSPAHNSCDTVYLAVSDAQGNAISFINSTYSAFGTGIIPTQCGFTLQSRGANFSLYPPNHPNLLAPRKRPYHTIIPGLVTNLKDGSLHSVFGVMGGFMQPQGHVQVLLGQIVGGLSPQQALDAPRVCVVAEGDRSVFVEEGMAEEAIEGLKSLGHKVEVLHGWGARGRQMFGRGQIIRWTVDEVDGGGVWSAGSDMRGDGAAYPV